MLSDEILDFYFSLSKPLDLPEGVEVVFPFDNEETRRVMQLFFEKYYSDNDPRQSFLVSIQSETEQG